MNWFKVTLILLFSFLQTDFTFSQKSDKQRFIDIEKNMVVIINNIKQEQSLSKKDSLNNQLLTLFRSVLTNSASFEYPFDSLKNIGKLNSKDGKVRVFTWNIPFEGGSNRYYGFIQFKNDKKKVSFVELIDSREKFKKPINEILESDSWLGALYYSIIDIDQKEARYYILLGFDPNNLYTSKKVIEVLSFKDDLRPIFGLPVFMVGGNKLSRVIFEYSARATMNLRYIPENRMIVFDHLSPSRPDFEGNYQFYGPDFTFDGFKLENDMWKYLQDIDIRNPRRDKPKMIDTIQKLPEPGFLYKSKGGIPNILQK